MDYVLFGVKRVSPRAGGGIDCMGLKSLNIELMFSKICLFVRIFCLIKDSTISI